jgi:hypothetical protein
VTAGWYATILEFYFPLVIWQLSLKCFSTHTLVLVVGPKPVIRRVLPLWEQVPGNPSVYGQAGERIGMQNH